MTSDELQASLQASAPFLSAEEWGTFLTSTPEDQETISQGFALARVPPSVDVLRTALDILQAADGFIPLPGIGPGITVLRKLIGE